MEGEAVRTSREEMIARNKDQGQFYDRVHSELGFEGATTSAATTFWSRIRSGVWDFERLNGDMLDVVKLHRQHIGDVSESTVLELGVGQGRALSDWLAQDAAKYIAIDLSEKAIAAYQVHLATLSCRNATALTMDFLDNKFPSSSFDVIYAMSVLHHFKDLDVLIAELLRVLKPGGLVVSMDAMQTEPVNRFARNMYRRRQFDRDWSWPFTARSFSKISESFEIAGARGVLGASKVGLPLFFVPGCRDLALRFSRWGGTLDRQFAKPVNLAFRQCWQVALVLRKPTG